MISDNYLHIQRWQPNFVAESAKISTLSVWVRFPQLPIEYYNNEWLRKARDNIGRTIKIDSITLAMTQGKFAEVCVKIDLNKSVRAYYRMRGRHDVSKYEGLQGLCFTCGKYGHKEMRCLLKTTKESLQAEMRTSKEEEENGAQWQDQGSSFGPWMVAQQSCRCPPMKVTKCTFGNQSGTPNLAGDQGETKSIPILTPIGANSREERIKKGNQESRFTMLSDQLEMEIEVGMQSFNTVQDEETRTKSTRGDSSPRGDPKRVKSSVLIWAWL